MGEMKMVIVMRRDLHMRKGKIAAQAGHACVSVVLAAMERNGSAGATAEEARDALSAWLTDGQKKVCVYVDGEEALLEVHRALEERGILSVLIQDAGHTEFHGEPTLTCLATEPETNERLDPVTGTLPLY